MNSLANFVFCPLTLEYISLSDPLSLPAHCVTNAQFVTGSLNLITTCRSETLPAISLFLVHSRRCRYQTAGESAPFRRILKIWQGPLGHIFYCLPVSHSPLPLHSSIASSSLSVALNFSSSSSLKVR